MPKFKVIFLFQELNVVAPNYAPGYFGHIVQIERVGIIMGICISEGTFSLGLQSWLLEVSVVPKPYPE